MFRNNALKDDLLTIDSTQNVVSNNSHLFEYVLPSNFVITKKQTGVVDDRLIQNYLLLKGIFDFIFSLTVLVILSPLLIFVAVAILIIDEHFPFYLHERIGLHGKKFKVYKFKSMKDTVDPALLKIIKEKEISGILFKSKDDPRISTFGKILRRTSIDELPQLFNVLKGDMSLIGPRPVPQFFLNPLSKKEIEIRTSVKPGLTGLWQISAREKDNQIIYMIDYDLKYVRNLSFSQDLKIFLKTFKVLNKGS